MYWPRKDRIKEKFERSVRLGAPDDLGAEEDDVATAQRRIHNRRTLIEVLLSPRPPALQRARAIEPGHCLHAAGARFGQETERGTLVKKHIQARFESPRQRIGSIDANLQNRTGDVELVLRQRDLDSSRWRAVEPC